MLDHREDDPKGEQDALPRILHLAAQTEPKVTFFAKVGDDGAGSVPIVTSSPRESGCVREPVASPHVVFLRQREYLAQDARLARIH
jgi:hypothetical protein